MATKFEGKWRNTNIANSNAYVEYEFKDKEFTVIYSENNIKFYGNFVFDDISIIFEIFTEDQKWTQKYILTDTYLDLQVEKNKHYNGRFFRQIVEEVK